MYYSIFSSHFTLFLAFSTFSDQSLLCMDLCMLHSHVPHFSTDFSRFRWFSLLPDPPSLRLRLFPVFPDPIFCVPFPFYPQHAGPSSLRNPDLWITTDLLSPIVDNWPPFLWITRCNFPCKTKMDGISRPFCPKPVDKSVDCVNNPPQRISCKRFHGKMTPLPPRLAQFLVNFPPPLCKSGGI